MMIIVFVQHVQNNNYCFYSFTDLSYWYDISIEDFDISN